MTLTITPAQLVAAIRAEGVVVRTDDWWSQVPHPGSWVNVSTGRPWDPQGITNHHTGPYTGIPAILSLLENGRSDLAGPLCQGGLEPSGVLDMIGFGSANHAGAGDPDVLAAVRADRPSPPPDDTDATAIPGNEWFFGFEWIHPGDPAVPWPAAQYDAGVRINAAICRLLGWTANRAGFHKGWTTRKVDPGALSIVKFRADVAARLAIPLPSPHEEDDLDMVDPLLLAPLVMYRTADHSKVILTDRRHQRAVSPEAYRAALARGGIPTVPDSASSDSDYAAMAALPAFPD